MSATFSSAQAARQARVSERQLDLWVHAGYLVPEQGSTGTGRPRRWSTAEIDLAEMLGVFSRQLVNNADLMRLVPQLVRRGNRLTLIDHDHEIVIELRARRNGNGA